jgi:hypothetical protein
VNRGSCLLAFFIAMEACMSNCPAQVEIESGYGRIAGAGFGNSINGTGVFAGLFRERHRTVDTSKLISPKIEGYQTIVWFPDRFEAPGNAVVEHLNRWLQSDQSRTLIYVGRDYDAAVDFWQIAVESSTGKQNVLARRMLAQSVTEFETRRNTVGLDEQCDWFQMKGGSEQPAKQLNGLWSNQLTTSNSSIRQGRIRLVPPTRGAMGARPHQVLLGSSAGPLIYRLQPASTFDGQVIVVTNGSMLMNYSLVNSENRVLADLLVAESSRFGKVLFLESGPEDIRISNTDARQGAQWAWVGQPPLNYIVPHFLVLGVIYCFVWFPIFGRARRLPSDSNSNFGLHIESVGRSLANSGQEDEARRIIDRYRHSVKHEESQKGRALH